MTKTLTEQWRDGKLPEGYYYVNGEWINYYSKDDGYFNDGGVEEVLAPVPSYDEIKRLQKQLADANKLILSLKHHAICDFDRIIYGEYIDKWGVK